MKLRCSLDFFVKYRSTALSHEPKQVEHSSDNRCVLVLHFLLQIVIFLVLLHLYLYHLYHLDVVPIALLLRFPPLPVTSLLKTAGFFRDCNGRMDGRTDTLSYRDASRIAFKSQTNIPEGYLYSSESA